MKSFLLLLFGYGLVLPQAWSQEELTGFAGYPGKMSSKDMMSFRTPSKDYTLNVNKLSPEIRSLLSSSEQVSIKVPSSAIISSTEVQNGVRPNCGELPMSYDKLKDLAQKSEIKTQMDFLNSIPAGTLQNFTFTYKSESAQGAGVSPEFPGVIRSSSDGKLIIRYTCDETKDTFGKVEVLTFDSATKKYKMADFNFKSKASDHKITENPKSCMACHNPGGPEADPDPRPNWQAYDQWNGFYGSQDDSFGLNGSSGKPFTQVQADEEKKNYFDFRAKQKDNPCYSSLPWPKKEVEPEYPYSNRGRALNLARRPGLKLTVNQCHLTAQRLARRISSKPEYQKLKYALAMKTMKCKDGYKPEQIQTVIPGFVDGPASYDNRFSVKGNPRHSGQTSSLHFLVGRKLGIADKEWTMHYNQDKNLIFDCGVSPEKVPGGVGTRDLGIGELMEGELMRDLAKDLPGLDGTFKTSQGEKQTFGSENACLDDDGGSVVIQNQEKACAELKAAQEKLAASVLDPQAAASNLTELNKLTAENCETNPGNPMAPVASVLADIQKAAIELEKKKHVPDPVNGQKIVNSVCIHCHLQTDNAYGFFADEASIKKHVSEHPEFKKRLEARLKNKEDPMPPYGPPMSEDDQIDVSTYINQFTAK